MLRLNHLPSLFTDIVPEGNMRTVVSVSSLTRCPRVISDFIGLIVSVSSPERFLRIYSTSSQCFLTDMILEGNIRLIVSVSSLTCFLRVIIRLAVSVSSLI